MSRLSIFDIYKIGVGPSSSHTLGPWRAALDFRDLIQGAGAGAEGGNEIEVETLSIQLFGSLSKTGVGHGTDVAVMLGLMGYDPVTIDTTAIGGIIAGVRAGRVLGGNVGSGHTLILRRPIPFDPVNDIIFQPTTHPGHPNTLTFTALLADGQLLRQTYHSPGGGFFTREGEAGDGGIDYDFPHRVNSGERMVKTSRKLKKSISRVLYENERAIRSSEEIHRRVRELYETMIDCVFRGCTTEGVLPGGLGVTRRAADLCRRLLNGRVYDNRADWLAAVRNSPRDFRTVNKWISCFALAVNEENAALGRVVTSPTNGASGVIPAVLLYHFLFNRTPAEEANEADDLLRFFLVSGQVGALFKQGATISAAVGGCQAEVGVSSAMAAAGLTEMMGGSTRQVLQAAEIAMEHHLGLTCDPIGGLVQIPCIERNAMGAMKAITASNLALVGNAADAIVKFDHVVQTMWETAQDMHHKYKETAEGGLAVVVPEC